MVSDNHEITDLEVKVDSTCSIGHKEVLYSKYLHHPDREGDKLHRITFIIMETALHGNDRLAAKIAGDEISFVTYRSGHRKTRNISIWYDYRIFYFIRESAQTASKNNSHMRLMSIKS